MLISIITINFNNKDGLKQTINSVISQNYSDYEFIVIDGGSSDGSVNIIKEHSSYFSFWQSKTDKGIYDAMNNGIKKATGKYLMFLNSGDYFSDNTVLQKCVDSLYENPEVDIFYGDIYGIRDDTVGINVHKHPPELDLIFWQKSNINHQSALIKATLFKDFGQYPDEYKLAGDHWFFLLCFLRDKKFFHIPLPIIVYDYRGASSVGRVNYVKEMDDIWEKLVPSHLVKLVNHYNQNEVIAQNPIVIRSLQIDRLINKVKNKIRVIKRKLQ